MVNKSIDRRIQKHLKQKENALRKVKPVANTENSYNLTWSDMNTRTTFIRMISNKEDAAIIQGGTMFNPLDAEGNILDERTRFGSKETYSYDREEYGTQYISGIKSIEVTEREVFKSTRKASISWVCGSIKELDELKNHFLFPGGTVLLEWGWVYKNQKEPTSPFYVKDGDKYRIINEAFMSPNQKILDYNPGTYDAMAGIILNFDYSMREDGAFDCNTSLISLGNNYFGNKIKDNFKKSIDEADGERSHTMAEVVLNMYGFIKKVSFGLFIMDERAIQEVNEATKKQQQKVENDVREQISTGGPNAPIMAYATKESKKNQIDIKNKKIASDAYFKKVTDFFKELTKKEDFKDRGGFKCDIPGYDGCFLIPSEDGNVLLGRSYAPKKEYESKLSGYIGFREIKDSPPEPGSFREDIWVRWGWFEDEILSKFNELNTKDVQINKFNSENVKILNNLENLVPKNLMDSLLPGTALPASRIDYSAIGYDVDTTDEKGNIVYGNKSILAHRQFMDALLSYVPTVDGIKREFTTDNSKTGNIRNIMINIKQIQEALLGKDQITPTDSDAVIRSFNYVQFDLKEKVQATSDNYPNIAKNTDEFILRTLKKLNDNFFNVWNFSIVKDENNHLISKITDNNFNEETAISENKNLYTKFDVNTYEIKGDVGIYKFPAFNIGSIVSKQDLSFKIPDKMQVAAALHQSTTDEAVIRNANEGSEELLPLYQNPDDKFFNPDLLLENIKIEPSTFDNVSLIGSTTLSDKNTNDETKNTGGEDKGAVDTPQQKLNKEQQAAHDLNLFHTWSLPLAIDEAEEFVELERETVDPEDEENKVRKAELLKGEGRFYVLSDDGETEYEVHMFGECATIQESFLKSLTNPNSIPNTTDSNMSKFPDIGKLTLEIDGTSGIYLGSNVQTDYIQKYYNETLIDKNTMKEIGPFTYFTISSLSHRVDESGWKTEFETLMSFNQKAIALKNETLPAKFVEKILEKSKEVKITPMQPYVPPPDIVIDELDIEDVEFDTFGDGTFDEEGLLIDTDPDVVEEDTYDENLPLYEPGPRFEVDTSQFRADYNINLSKPFTGTQTTIGLSIGPAERPKLAESKEIKKKVDESVEAPVENEIRNTPAYSKRSIQKIDLLADELVRIMKNFQGNAESEAAGEFGSSNLYFEYEVPIPGANDSRQREVKGFMETIKADSSGNLILYNAPLPTLRNINRASQNFLRKYIFRNTKNIIKSRKIGREIKTIFGTGGNTAQELFNYPGKILDNKVPRLLEFKVTDVSGTVETLPRDSVYTFSYDVKIIDKRDTPDPAFGISWTQWKEQNETA